MARKSTANTFDKGLVMDLNPITTPNNVMTSALNVTMITFNGNEYVLQSDMGNGRVETAYLPSGYVPVGIVEFGGIIYVASYNPLIGKSQLGSFPSPERNISTEEINQNVVDLSNGDFGFNQSDGASTFYVQKNLYPDKLTPGDKYIVYTKIGSISSNNNKLWDCADSSNNAVNIGGQNVTKAVKLSFATITDEGKIVKLSNLRTYRVNGINGEYIVPEISYNGNKPNLDSYRSLVESPYNIFNSKVSGKLLLIAELVTIDEFNVSISCEFVGPDTAELKDVKISANISYTSDNNVFLYAVDSELIDSKTGTSKLNFKWNKTTIEGDTQIVDNREGNALMYTVKNYDYINRVERSVSYKITPCMSFGPIKYLMRSGIIQLDKIGTGYISLYEWRYYIDNNNIMINWALQSYPEEGYEIAGVRFIMSCYNRDGNVETIAYNVSKKQSYNGSFMENIPFNSDFYKFENDGKLLRDRLYYVTIEVQYQKSVITSEEDSTSRYKYFHRWLYTSNIFNKNYLDGVISDFISIKPDIDISVDSSLSLKKIEDEIKNSVEGKISSEYIEGHTVSNIDSMSAEQYYNKYKMIGNIKLKTENSYETFVLDTNTAGVSIKIDKDDVVVNINDYKIISTGDISIQAEEYLKIGKYDEWADGKIIKLPAPDNTKELIDKKYGNSAWTNGFSKTYNKGDIEITESDDIKLNTIEYIKAFGTISDKTVSWSSMIKPVANTDEDFSRYNLSYIGNNQFKTNFIGAWARTDYSGRKNRVRTYVSWVDSNNTVNDTVGKDGLSHDDGTQSFVRNYQDWFRDKWTAGLSSSIITVVYSSRHYGKNDDEGSGITPNEGRGNVRKADEWTYPMLDNGWAFCYIENKIGNVAISNNTGVMTFMRTAEAGVYVPINMMSQAEHRPSDVFNILYRRNVGGTRFGSSFNIPSVHTAIALMLIQIYKFENEGGSKKMWIPTVAYYIQKIITDFGINVNIEADISKNTKVYIKTDNDSKVYIDSAMKTVLFDNNHNKTNGNGGPNNNDAIESEEGVDNNIDFQFSKQPIVNLVSVASVREGLNLRDLFIDSMKTSFKTLVQKNDGTTKIVDVDFRNTYCYFIDDNGNVSRLSNNFQLTGGIIEKGDGDNYIFKSNNIPTSEKNEFSKKVCIKDGILMLNDSGTGENTGVMDGIKIGLSESPRSSGGNDVSGASLTGWSTFAPFSKLKFFTKR